MSETEIPKAGQTIHLPPGMEKLAATIIPNREMAKVERRVSIISSIGAIIGAIGLAFSPRVVKGDFARQIGLSAKSAANKGSIAVFSKHGEAISAIFDDHHEALSDALAKNHPFDIGSGSSKVLAAIREDVKAAKIGPIDQFNALHTFTKVTSITLGAVLAGLTIYQGVAAVKNWRSSVKRKEEATHTENLVKERVRAALDENGVSGGIAL